MEARREKVVVWAALLALLGANLILAGLPLGLWQPAVTVTVATVMAGLILWYYMHLSEATGLIRLFAAAGFVWLTFLLGLGIIDWLTR